MPCRSGDECWSCGHSPSDTTSRAQVDTASFHVCPTIDRTKYVDEWMFCEAMAKLEEAEWATLVDDRGTWPMLKARLYPTEVAGLRALVQYLNDLLEHERDEMEWDK